MSEECVLSKKDLKEGKAYKSKGGIVCKILKVDAEGRVWAQTAQQKAIVEIPDDARFKEAETSDSAFPAKEAVEIDKEIGVIKEKKKEKENAKVSDGAEEKKTEAKKEKKEKKTSARDEAAKLYPVISKHIEEKFQSKAKENSVKFKLGDIVCKFNAVDAMVITSEKLKDKTPNKEFKTGKWKARYHISNIYDLIAYKA